MAIVSLSKFERYELEARTFFHKIVIVRFIVKNIIRNQRGKFIPLSRLGILKVDFILLDVH